MQAGPARDVPFPIRLSGTILSVYRPPDIPNACTCRKDMRALVQLFPPGMTRRPLYVPAITLRMVSRLIRYWSR